MRSVRLDLCIMSLCLVMACDDDDDSGSAAIASKLRECQLVSEGKVNPFVANLEVDECRARCDAAGTCEELERYLCALGGPSARMIQCYADCLLTDCNDGKGTFLPAQRCNARDDCADGSDERACSDLQGPEFCAESGAIILPVQRCNGADDCGDGSDEAGCPVVETFTCKTMALGVSQQIPKTQVCDLTRNCADGSDESEAESCAQPTCP